MPTGPAARARLLPGLAVRGRPPAGRPAPAAAPRLTGLPRTPRPLSRAPPRPARQVHLGGAAAPGRPDSRLPSGRASGRVPSPPAASSANPGAGRAAAPFVPSREGGLVRPAGRHSGRPPGRALQRQAGSAEQGRWDAAGSCLVQISRVGGSASHPGPACAQPFTPGSQNGGASARGGSCAAGSKAATLGLGGEACNSPQ